MSKKFMKGDLIMWKKYKFYVHNLDCANCARKLEEKLNSLEHYQNVVLNFAKLTLTFETDLQENVLDITLEEMRKIEPDVVLLEDSKTSSSSQKDLLFLGVGLLFYLCSLLLKIGWLSNFFCLCSYAVLGYRTFWQALKLLKKGILNENFLIVVSALGAFGIGKASEGFMVLFLYQIGKYFEKRATGNVRKNVANLMAMKPDVAHKKEKDGFTTLSPEEIKEGDVLVILQGEKVPLDGVLASDSCELDTSSLTGESKLSLLSKGEEVLSGSINAGVVFELKVTSTYENSTVKRILDLMEHASDKKAKVENFVNRAARYYTPIMMGIAFLIFLLTPMFFQISYQESLYRAFMVLVVSCPCAIAISVPLCYFAGLGCMSKHGILVKGSNYIDRLANLKQIVFDKTGTLTTGNFGVVDLEVLDESYTKEDVLQYLIYGESFSNHPLAKSIVSNYSEIKVPKLLDVKEIKGKGVSYSYQNKNVKIGSRNFVKTDLTVSGTVIYVSLDDHVIGYVIMGDEMKENAKDVIEALSKSGIHTKMFTGDKKDVAEETCARISLDSFVSDLLPDGKVEEFENLKKEHDGEVIAFVGDGINDAPVLRLSDCGIAMGSGSASALEASDVVIISSDLEKLLEARKISKKTIFILKQNLVFALSIKFIVLVFSLFGIGSMALAVFADVGVTLLTILNSLRVLK